MPALYVETVGVPIDLGEYFAILRNYFVTSLDYFFLFVVADMLSFRANLHTPLDRGSQAGASKPLASIPPHAQQQ